MGNVLTYRTFLLGMALLGAAFGGIPAAQAAPVSCDVTSDKDINTVTGLPVADSLRMALVKALGDGCIDKKITIKVPKITMTAPLGIGLIQALQGYTIAPEPSLPSVEIRVSYDTTGPIAGCSAPSPFADCFAYLPTANVSIHDIQITVDPSALSAPLRGLCIDTDADAAFSPSNNRIRLEKNEFTGFSKGGVFISANAYGVLISQSTFHESGAGIVVEQDPAILVETPAPPIMGGSNQALYASTDTKAAVVEYHLRGLSQDATSDSVIPIVELYEGDGKAGTTYIKNCNFTKEMIDGKWNIECVLPKTITLPFHYAVTITRNVGAAPNTDPMTSMFSVGTIPADVAQVPVVTPSEPQTPVVPPKPPIISTNPPAYQGGPEPSGDAADSLSLTAGSPTGGCSLIR